MCFAATPSAFTFHARTHTTFASSTPTGTALHALHAHCHHLAYYYASLCSGKDMTNKKKKKEGQPLFLSFFDIFLLKDFGFGTGTEAFSALLIAAKREDGHAFLHSPLCLPHTPHTPTYHLPHQFWCCVVYGWWCVL